MNRAKLKNYAPQARRDFIQAMTDRAAIFGVRPGRPVSEVTPSGDAVLIEGREFPKSIIPLRGALVTRVHADGFAATMEKVAYTWFNRLVALRYMELHGYLNHGCRVLSNPKDDLAGKKFLNPEILERAEHLDLPNRLRGEVIQLKLAGNRDEQLYRRLLLWQCDELRKALLLLFDQVLGEAELLLPDNLLHSDSLIRKMVGEVDEEDWQEVEIIGWLYQFYISEKKDEVIGKVVASEDIPAATQLFTPNWIVKYLVQNTLGRQWLATYPQSPLRQQMAYYIEPAEQTPEVQAQLKAITPTSLNPEELTMLDPACGSGHILVEGYDLFKAIYTERGYNKREIPRLILQKNLFGLEIDDRAAQLAAFALMMKARADDRRIFDSDAKPNVVALQDSQGLSAADINHALNSPINKDDVPSEYLFEEIEEEKLGLFSKKALAEKGHVSQADTASLLALFENAKTCGSLIQVPPKLAAKLPEIENRLDEVLKHGDLSHATAHVLKTFLQQARLLSQQYHAVVANPPYMGPYSMNATLKALAKEQFEDCKADTFAMFISRALGLVKRDGSVGMVTMHAWMFTGAFETFRRRLLQETQVIGLAHLGSRAFDSISGEVVQTVAFVITPTPVHNQHGTYLDLTEGRSEAEKSGRLKQIAEKQTTLHTFRASSESFKDLPGSPIAYWLPEQGVSAFRSGTPLTELCVPKKGMTSSDNARFLRRWQEVSIDRIVFNCPNADEVLQSGRKWVPYNKGGEFRKWYGNHSFLINWERSGREVIGYAAELYGSASRQIQNVDSYFKPCVTWSEVGSGPVAGRQQPQGSIFDSTGPSLFGGEGARNIALALLCTNVVNLFTRCLNPTLHLTVRNVAALPVPPALVATHAERISRIVTECVAIARSDWDASETSWDFGEQPLLRRTVRGETVEASWQQWEEQSVVAIRRMQALETDNNRLFINAYGLQDQLSPEVLDDQITLYRPEHAEDIKRLLSHAIGCMMGRYSLDKPGLIYARSGNQGFDPGQYKIFRADDDGIIPLLETDWGIRDDATNRFVEFIGVAWPKEHLEENLKFVADSLGTNTGEQPRDTIRRYLATGFYKHHLSMYKKRPIYWLFSSGKQRAFQCLVYLHRYNEGTLARMRTEYVIPLQGLIASRIDQLEGDKTKATSTSHRKKLQKEQDDLKKQQIELAAFEEKLKHVADQKITLDLDDGVKVNYAKFGDLLAESKAITGGKDDE